MSVQTTIQQIAQSVRVITDSAEFEAWYRDQKPKPDNLVIFNSSFIRRAGISTNKGNRFLALPIDENGSPAVVPVVISGFGIRTDFKLVSKRSKNFPQTIALHDAIEAQLPELGELVFILSGTVDDSVVQSEAVNHSECSELILDPELPEPVVVDHDRRSVSIKDTYDEEVLWQAASEAFGEDSGLRRELGIALDKLQARAYAHLRFPNETGSGGESVIDGVVAVLDEQRDIYAQALEDCKGDPAMNAAAYNEILRIAYNFSSDASTFVELVTNVCDLKPLLLWGTIGQHFAFTSALRKLPWLRARSKPSLDNYHGTIADARNSSFHHLFPFKKTLQVELPDIALQNVSLTIFSEYKNRNENELRYQGKELVDVLTRFTRAGERRVPAHFWYRNLDVMDAAIDLFAKLGGVLTALHPISRDIAGDRPAIGAPRSGTIES